MAGVRLPDESQMLELVRFARRALATPRRSPFASSVVETRTGRRVARCLNRARALGDPTAHAEVVAIRTACRRLKSTSLAGFTLYTTCEPCPMCMAAALWSRVDRVVFGATIADASRHCAQIHTGARQLVRRSDLRCEVSGPVARAACAAVFADERLQADFRTWHRARRPG